MSAAGGRERARPSAYDAAVRMLAARALSAGEVGQRLTRKGYTAAEIESALQALEERRYLDDRTLAYNVGSFLASRRRFGRMRVAAELARRLLPSDAAREALERVYAEIDEEAMALHAAQDEVRTARGRGRGPQAVQERLMRSLLRRGFPRGVAIRALRASVKDIDDDDVQTDA